MYRDYVDVQVIAPGFQYPDRNRQEDAATPSSRRSTAQVNCAVLIHWAVTFLSNDRSQRTATEQQIFARQALKRLPRGASELVSDPGYFEERRAELEATAAEEARLTDSGERGRVAPERV